MNEQQTIRFILENSSEPVIKNPVLRAALQEPRTMAQGGGIIGKPGGLVEPGVEYYAKAMTKEGKARQLAALKGIQDDQAKASKIKLQTFAKEFIKKNGRPPMTSEIKEAIGTGQQQIKKYLIPGKTVATTEQAYTFKNKEYYKKMQKDLPENMKEWFEKEFPGKNWKEDLTFQQRGLAKKRFADRNNPQVLNRLEYEKLDNFLKDKIAKGRLVFEGGWEDVVKEADLDFRNIQNKKMDVKTSRELVSKYIRDTFPKTFVARGMQWEEMPAHIEAKVIELSKTKAPGEIQAQLMKEGLIPKSKAAVKVETRGMKSFMEGLKNQGKIETVLKDPLGSLTALEQTRRDKIVREFIKTNPDITNSFQIAKRINSFNPDLALSRNFVESAIKREGLDPAIQNRFEVIFDDIKAIDKVIKKNSNIVLNERVSWKKRVEDLTKLYQKETGKPMEIAIDEFGARLTRLGNLYAGTGGDRYATKLYDTIKAPANYMNSKFQKQLIAISSASNKTLSNSEMARLLGLPAKEIELIDNTSAMMRSFPFKVAGDHTDIKSLMKEDIKNYKKNFTRIEHIKDSLNQYKRTYDIKIKNLYDRAKGASPAAKAIFLEQAKELEDKFQRNTNYRIGNFNIKDGRLVIDPKTPRIGSFDSPLNRYLQQSMRNFETTINPKLKSIPETKVTKFTNPIDKQYMSADQKEIKKIFEYADKNPKIAKGSQVLKSFSKVPGPVGKAAKLIIAGGAGATAVATVANASETGVVDKAKSFPIEHPWLTGGAATGVSKLTKADPLKLLRKIPRKILSSLGTPAGAVAAWPLAAMGMKKAGWMEEDASAFDIKRTGDRIGAEAELALAPTLVKWTDKFTKPIKNQAVRSGVTRLLNLGMSPAMALRAARVASPIGLLSLAGEGFYHAHKKEMAKRAQMSPEELADFHLERQSRGWAGKKGIMGLKKKKW